MGTMAIDTSVSGWPTVLRIVTNIWEVSTAKGELAACSELLPAPEQPSVPTSSQYATKSRAACSICAALGR
jgi:hypothetical protein